MKKKYIYLQTLEKNYFQEVFTLLFMSGYKFIVAAFVDGKSRNIAFENFPRGIS